MVHSCTHDIVTVHTVGLMSSSALDAKTFRLTCHSNTPSLPHIDTHTYIPTATKYQRCKSKQSFIQYKMRKKNYMKIYNNIVTSRLNVLSRQQFLYCECNKLTTILFMSCCVSLYEKYIAIFFKTFPVSSE